MDVPGGTTPTAWLSTGDWTPAHGRSGRWVRNGATATLIYQQRRRRGRQRRPPDRHRHGERRHVDPTRPTITASATETSQPPHRGGHSPEKVGRVLGRRLRAAGCHLHLACPRCRHGQPGPPHPRWDVRPPLVRVLQLSLPPGTGYRQHQSACRLPTPVSCTRTNTSYMSLVTPTYHRSTVRKDDIVSTTCFRLGRRRGPLRHALLSHCSGRRRNDPSSFPHENH